MNPASRQARSRPGRLPPRTPARPRDPHSPPTGPLPPVPAGVDRRRPELSDAALVSRSWAMAFATLISRLTGFARIVVLAAILGAALSSAFSVANQLPNLVAALVLEATFTAIFVPVLARAEQGDPDGGAAFVRRLVTMTTTLLVVATALSVLAAPLLVRLMLGRTPQVNEPLTTAFAYLLLPQVLAYGLTSVFMAILNTRNVFGPTAWAPVVNNVVALVTLVVYVLVPGELSVDPVRMGNAKLLVLGIGTTLGVFAQTAVLLVALRRQRISLRPLWGVDDRLKRFGTMAAAMVLYVLISQLGLVVGNQIASTAAASGPAIYNYTWLVLMLPFGMIGVTVLTVVMPRLSRNAAADDTRAVLADLSLATRLTLITLIPIVAFMTVAGPAIGSALFAYGHFGGVDAGYLGAAIALSAFTLIPYGLVLLQLRVFYAREQPWTPIVIILVITAVKIGGSVLAPHLTGDHKLVAGLLGLANGVGFLAGAVVGYVLLRRALLPRGGHLIGLGETRTILVATAASLLAGLIAHVADRLLRLGQLTANGGGAGSLLRLVILSAIMLPIVAAVMLWAGVPEARAAAAAVRRRLGGRVAAPGLDKAAVAAGSSPSDRFTYPEHRNSSPPEADAVQQPIRRSTSEGSLETPPERAAGARLTKGPEVTDRPIDSPASGPVSGGERRRPVADDFQPDIPADRPETPASRPFDQLNGDLPADAGRGGPGPIPSAPNSTDEPHLVPGARIAGGRYRLLVFHGGAAAAAVLAGAGHRPGPAGGADLHRPRRHAPPRRATGHPVAHAAAQPDRQARGRPRPRRRADRVRRLGGLGVDPRRLAARRSPKPRRRPSAPSGRCSRWPPPPTRPTAPAWPCRSTTRTGCGSASKATWCWPTRRPCPTPTRKSDIRGIGASLYALLVNRWPLPESGVRSGLARRGPGSPPATPSSPWPSTVPSRSRSPPWPCGRSRRTAEYAARQRF